MPPANDELANAQVLSAPSGGIVSVVANNIDSTVESGNNNDETDFGWVNTVWFYFEATETMTGWPVRITNADFVYYAAIYEFTGTPAHTGDLFTNGNFIDELGGGDTDPDEVLIDVVAGNRYYIVFTNWDFTEGIWGTATLSTLFPIPQVCLDAVDYISGSASVSVVSGSVRETQKLDGDSNLAFEGLWGDLTPTLVIPGEDIADSPGFYAVEVKTKNAFGSLSWYAGLIRNGQPLHPGSFIDTDLVSTPIDSYITAPPFFDKWQGLNNVWYLPVQPGDEIEVVLVFHQNSAPTAQLDIEQICFQRVKSATEGPSYDLLDIPDYPLGTSVSDMNTADQIGDLHLYKSTAPTYTNAEVQGADICVTDDGNVWVAAMTRVFTTSGTKYIGPYLMMWNGSTWTIINDDIEGLGVKRDFRGGASSAFNSAPYDVSIDTDGEDIWVAYGVDAGVAPIGGFRSTAIKVRKYDVSGASWSTIGGLISGGTPVNTRSYAGSFDTGVVVRVSPAGVPWVCFTDLNQHSNPVWAASATPAFVARWTGSDWDIDMLPMEPGTLFPIDDDSTTQATTIISGSGTVSIVTEDGESCVRDTQTTYAADTVVFTPPAGQWAVRAKVQYNKTAGLGGVKGKFYKNGATINVAADDLFLSSSGTAHSWTKSPLPATGYYFDCDGSDTISLRIARTGTATEVFVDEITLVPAQGMINNLGFGPVQADFSDNATMQYVQLVFHQVGEDGFGENPAAIYQSPFVPYVTDPDAEGYVAEGAAANSFAVGYQYFVYCEWNGSEWERVWYRIVEDDAPDHVQVLTRTDGFSSTPPYGHFHEGLSFFSDGQKNYVGANLSAGQAFGFFGDMYTVLEVGPEGFIPFSEGPTGILGGFGYGNQEIGQTTGAHWAHACHAKSGIKDAEGTIWFGVAVEGTSGEWTPMIHTYAKNGLGDWFAASEDNEQRGYPELVWPNPALAISPDGTTLYSLDEAFIYAAPSFTEGPTFGVWACPITRDAKIPLIPLMGGIDLSRVRMRAFYIGDA